MEKNARSAFHKVTNENEKKERRRVRKTGSDGSKGRRFLFLLIVNTDSIHKT